MRGEIRPDGLYSPKKLALPLIEAAKMVKVFLSLALLTLVARESCSKNKEAGVPACIQARIDSIKAQPKWNPPARVDEYEYRGRTVYLFSAPCCDQYHVAYDGECTYVCAPSGGMTGKGDRKCTDFAHEAKLVRTVWKDPR
jgi:hypothetical protein